MNTAPGLQKGFRVGPWSVLPERGILRGASGDEHLEPLVMNLLLELAIAGGDVVSKEVLIERLWQGRAQSDEPLLRAVSVLRRKLGDDSKNPTFIENIPRRGYRLLAPVEVASSSPPESADEAATERPAAGLRPGRLVAVLAVAIVVGYFVYDRLLSAPPAPDAPIRTLAIFPFQCAGTAEPYLCHGFSEELTASLLQVDEFRIIRRTELPPSGRTVRQIARDISVDAILTGSVQQIGDELRISPVVTDGRNEFVVYSQPKSGLVSNILDLQQEVAQEVADAIVGPSGEQLASRPQPQVTRAYHSFAQGQYLFERRNLDDLRTAIARFQEAISLDPGFGPAYLHLAFAYLLLPEYDSSLAEEDLYARAAETAENGIVADPSIEAAAGTVFGFIFHKRGEWLEATRAYERALNGDNSFALAHHWYSRLLATVGRMDESLSFAIRAYELDPASAVIISRRAIAHFWLSELDEADQYFALANELGLQAPIHDLAYALYLIRIGDIDESRIYTRQGLEKYQTDSGWVDSVFDGIEDPAQRAEAVTEVAGLEASGMLSDFILITLWALLDEPDRAMATALSMSGIGQDFETGYEVLFSDELAMLHDHRLFGELLDRAGLQDYWDELGCVADPVRVRCPAAAAQSTAASR